MQQSYKLQLILIRLMDALMSGTVGDSTVPTFSTEDRNELRKIRRELIKSQEEVKRCRKCSI